MFVLQSSASALLLLLLCGCSRERAARSEPVPSLSASGGAPSAPLASSSARVKKPAPWYEGTWAGDYDAEKHDPIAGRNAGRQLAWIKDKGKKFVGPGHLGLAIDPLGNIAGDGSGALGKMRVSGRVSGSLVHATMQPQGEGASIFSGTATGAIQDERIVLQMRFASADGRLIRSASASLEKSKIP